MSLNSFSEVKFPMVLTVNSVADPVIFPDGSSTFCLFKAFLTSDTVTP